MRNKIASLIAVAAASAAIGCAHASSALDHVGVGYSTIQNASGDTRGTAEMWQDADNVVHVEVQVTGMPPGPHGIHFHAVGSCESTSAGAFAGAGAHFNPLGRQHGLDNPQGPHGGDAPNFTVNADGTGRASFTTDRVSLTDGSTSLFDADGTAIVIHAAADDQISQPAGNSGARIACGVVRKTK